MEPLARPATANRECGFKDEARVMLLRAVKAMPGVDAATTKRIGTLLRCSHIIKDQGRSAARDRPCTARTAVGILLEFSKKFWRPGRARSVRYARCLPPLSLRPSPPPVTTRLPSGGPLECRMSALSWARLPWPPPGVSIEKSPGSSSGNQSIGSRRWSRPTNSMGLSLAWLRRRLTSGLESAISMQPGDRRRRSAKTLQRRLAMAGTVSSTSCGDPRRPPCSSMTP